MNMRNFSPTGLQAGFSMIESLVTLGIISFGLLSITYMQGDFLSKTSTNKSRGEAISLAQARLEELRNYTNTASSRLEFEARFADTPGYVNSTLIDGVNSSFTRMESITSSGLSKLVAARVSWSDRANRQEQIELVSEIAWQPPRGPGDISREDVGPIVPSPSGEATLGEGELPDGAPVVSNDDGTSKYVDGPDLKLVSGDNIVLTLANVCNEEGCKDFVRVNGRVYIDRETQRNLTPGAVSVRASNNAYCTRYYHTESGELVTLTNDTGNARATENDGDYEYFDYRCYMGGGWHGNIGIILEGGNSLGDKICQGDPVSPNPWEEPVISARRVYRGMVYKSDPNTLSGKVEDESGVPVFWTTGIDSSVELGIDPSTNEPTHNFVVSKMPTTATTGDNCISKGIMVRPDATVGSTPGGIFDGMPGDFFCLNPFAGSYIDTDQYVLEPTCPFDPSGPPVEHYVVSGVINVDARSALAAAVTLNTSDGPGNCVIESTPGSGGSSSVDYRCDVYDWGSGWNGYIQVNPGSPELACTADRLYLDNVTSDTTGPFFECVEGHGSVVRGSLTLLSGKRLDAVSITEAVTGLTGHCSFTDNSYSCVTNIHDSAAWDGALDFSTNGTLCTDAGAVGGSSIALVELDPGKVVTLDITIAKNANGCP